MLVRSQAAKHRVLLLHRHRLHLAFSLLALLAMVGYGTGVGQAAQLPGGTEQIGHSSPPAAQETEQGATGEERAGEQAVAVEVKDMSITPAGVAITLVSDEADQELHLMIGPAEGQAIVRALRHAKLARPMTHDLMKTLVEAGGWRVSRVIIGDLRNHTFFAELVLERPGEFGIEGNVEEKIIDARPSDAMALGLRFEAPIYVRQKVFDLERETREQELKEKLEEPESRTI